MTQDNLRLLVVVGLLGFLVYRARVDDAPTVPSAAYTGPMASLHRESRSMDPGHRAAMAEAFSLASQAVEADNTGAITTTRQWQRAMEAVLQFGYRDFGRVATRYPRVAEEIQAELSRVAGTDDVPIVDRARFSNCPREISAAVR